MSQSIPISLDQLITTSTFAHIADRSESTVRDWDRRGVVTAVARTPSGADAQWRAPVRPEGRGTAAEPPAAAAHMTDRNSLDERLAQALAAALLAELRAEMAEKAKPVVLKPKEATAA
jgi:hypothetical protein